MKIEKNDRKSTNKVLIKKSDDKPQNIKINKSKNPNKSITQKIECPSCGDIIDKKITDDSEKITCPSCLKDINLSNKKSPLVIGGICVGVVIAILFIFIFINAQVNKAKADKLAIKRATEEKARLVALEQAQKIEDENRRWLQVEEEATREKIKTENDYIRLFSLIKDFYGGDPDAKDNLKAKLEKFKAEDIQQLMDKLNNKANALISNNKFTDAAGIYQNYSLDFKDETEKLRDKKANICYNKEDQYKADQKRKKEELKRESDTLLNNLSAGLITGKTTEAINNFESSPLKKELPKVSKIVNNLRNFTDIIIKSFTDDIGDKVVFILKKKKPAKGLIKNVNKGKVYIESKKSNLVMIKKYSLKQFDSKELGKRLSKFDKETGALYLGINAIKKKKYDLATKFFQEAGPLSVPLRTQLMILKDKTTETKMVTEEDIEKERPNKMNWRRLKDSAKVSTSKKRVNGGVFKEVIKSKTKLTNKMGHDIDGYTVSLLLIAKSLKNKKSYKVLTTYREDLNLKNNESITQSYSFDNKYDEGSEAYLRSIPRSGFKYYGWIFIIQDENDKVVKIDSKHSKFKSNITTILQAGENTF